MERHLFIQPFTAFLEKNGKNQNYSHTTFSKALESGNLKVERKPTPYSSIYF